MLRKSAGNTKVKTVGLYSSSVKMENQTAEEEGAGEGEKISANHSLSDVYLSCKAWTLGFTVLFLHQGIPWAHFPHPDTHEWHWDFMEGTVRHSVCLLP